MLSRIFDHAARIEITYRWAFDPNRNNRRSTLLRSFSDVEYSHDIHQLIIQVARMVTWAWI